MTAQEMDKDFMSFVNSHSFKDKKEVYTNGAELVPVFRVQQAYDYYFLKLEKALDKACEELHSNSAWCHYGNMSKKCGLSKEEWKKELMKDD